MLSTNRFDYGEQQDVDYFAGELRDLNPDIVCLQESEFNAHESLTKRLANALSMPYFAETPGCPSHIDHGYQLTTAIIAKKRFTKARFKVLPFPLFELRFEHTGRVVPPYNRYLQTVSFDNFTVGTLHTEPLEAFGRRYEQDAGQDLAHTIDALLVKELKAPLLLAADFNMSISSDTLPQLLANYQLREALPNEPTKPHGNQPDHILYSPEWKLVNAGIEHTQSDHYLCWADIELGS
jgi:endonuclease/exonuclease/phosphatase family metal-dependent hydrolase